MKHLFTLITMLLFISANAQLKVEFLSGFKMDNNTRCYTYEDVAIFGNALKLVTDETQTIQDATNRTIYQVNQAPFVNLDTINIMGFNNFASKQRKAVVKRYLTTGTLRLSVDGLELLGALELGLSSTNGISAGASVSGFINAGIVNLFGGDFEPLELGRFTYFNWYESLSVGYTVKASTESLFFNKSVDQSFDVKIQIPIVNDRERKEKRINLFLIKSFYTSDVKGWECGLNYKI